jgi:hypothetical protein
MNKQISSFCHILITFNTYYAEAYLVAFNLSKTRKRACVTTLWTQFLPMKAVKFKAARLFVFTFFIFFFFSLLRTDRGSSNFSVAVI